MDIQNVEKRLATANRFYQRQQALKNVLGSLKYIVGAVLLLFLLDVVFHLSPQKRIATGMGYICIVFLWGIWMLFYAFVKSNSKEVMARRLEERDPSLGSSLINALQLSKQIKHSQISEVTRSLTIYAIRDYLKKTEKIDFKKLLLFSSWKSYIAKVLLTLTVFIGILGAFSSITKLELLRFTDPYGDYPPYSFTHLQIISPQEKIKVIYGQAVLVKGKATGHQPQQLFLSFYAPEKPQKITTLQMFYKGELGFFQKIENIKTSLFFYVHTKNLYSRSKKKSLGVIFTPQLKKASLTIIPPKYTRQKALHQLYKFNSTRALVGSTVLFSLTSNRPLSKGHIEVIERNSRRTIVMQPDYPNNHTVKGAFVVKQSARLRFLMTDIKGIESQQLLNGSITATYDLPPQISIANPQQNIYVVEDFKVHAQIVAKHDYGIKNIRLHRALNQRYSTPLVLKYNGERNIRENVVFDMPNLGVSPGDVISLYAEVIDTCPKPHLTTSEVIHLVVISVEDYNNILRKRMEIRDIEGKYQKLQEQLLQLRQEQEKLVKKMQKLKKELKKRKKRLKKKRLKRKIDHLIAGQSELNSKLKKLADMMAKFGRKKPLYDIEKDFQETLRQQAQSLRQAVSRTQKALKKFAIDSLHKNKKAKNSLVASLEALLDEGRKQSGYLGENQQIIQEDIVDTVEDIHKLNTLIQDFNYFKYLYELQAAIAKQTKAYHNIVRDLSYADRLALQKFAAQEKFIAAELLSLVKNLKKHAKDAQSLYPKAATSARKLAQKIEKARLVDLANRAANIMLLAKGSASYQIADRLRQEMRKFFKELKGSRGAGNSMHQELDRYLELVLGMDPGNTFRQMQMSQNQGQNGKGSSPGSRPSMNILGNERMIKRNKLKKGLMQKAKEKNIAMDKTNTPKTSNFKQHRSGSTKEQSFVYKYQDIVDAYFDKVVEEKK